MKKVSQAITAAGALYFLSTPLAFAQGVSNQNVINCPAGQFEKLCRLSATQFGTFLATIITIAFVAAIVIALAFLVYGGFKWIVSGGEKGALEEARNHIVASIVGLVIVFLAYFILNLVVFFFTGEGLTNIRIPSITTLN